MLEHIHTDIKALEKRIFSGYERDVVRDLLVLKRNIINFRKAMQFHKGMIRRLITKSDEYFSLGKQRIYFQNLIEHTKDIWDTLEIQKENIDALQDTNESLISFRLNDNMKSPNYYFSDHATRSARCRYFWNECNTYAGDW